ncbi:MAG TPA: TlpA disulfide reductase family protein [Panacibacter sp.]|nr:TlpA disulfide reductase family protein [Panacibacter sp.]HNP43554.1 TlpA disulfide reductase family protein [Panacibacter sp.]
MKRVTCFLIGLFTVFVCDAQQKNTSVSRWRAALHRPDGKDIVFELRGKKEQGKTVLYVSNAAEEIEITDIKTKGDSMFFTMPAFEASFRVKILHDGDMAGLFIKGTAAQTQHWPFTATAKSSGLFEPDQGNAMTNITGRWDVSITRANGTIRKAVAEFEQHGNRLTGTFLTPSADYRYLDGVVTGDSLKLSTFDGDNIHLFEAKVDSACSISGGVFYNGYAGRETWTALRNDTIELPEANAPTQMREGETKLNFTFKDLNGLPVSISDKKYKDKVVIIQLMGSWCANCLDETKFLSGYYKENKSRGVEVIALAYELSTDAARSKASLQKFQKLFGVQYPMLITGAAAGDDKKTEKTLPQLTPIRSFPLTIFIDKSGNVRYIHTSFYGPGSGAYYTAFKKDFYETADKLLQEQAP